MPFQCFFHQQNITNMKNITYGKQVSLKSFSGMYRIQEG